MLNKILSILVTLLVITASSCQKDVPNPEKATLSFPAQNTACTTGVVISSTMSTIIFTWNTSANTNSYDITVKNLLTGVQKTYTTKTNQLAVDLLRDTPYSWFVVSKSDITEVVAQSDTWKFYNAGLGTISHPPFPADAMIPSFGQSISAPNGTVNLSWVGSDPDNDLLDYDVYFGTTSNPVIIKEKNTERFENNVAVTSGNTYYWKVITRDKQGNTSDSGVFQFKVN